MVYVRRNSAGYKTVTGSSSHSTVQRRGKAGLILFTLASQGIHYYC